MTVENDVNVAQPEVDDIEVEVTENESQVADQSASSDDELENYTKSVSKRINKLNARNRETEERAAQLEAALRQREQEVHAYYQQAATAQQNLLAKEEETVEIKEREANELYKKAHASGDAELMSKADTLKSELSLQKEKVRIAKQRQEQANANTQAQAQPQQQYVQQEQQTVQPSQEALNWADKNPWFNQNQEATAWAEHVHNSLAGEGFDLDSDEYYEELNNRIYKVYPDLRSDNAEQREDRPAVQRVASASVGSRQKTQGKENGVRFTKSEVETLQGLKPHGMTDEAWLKSVAKEKQKLATREAK
jgi:hypothetical protein